MAAGLRGLGLAAIGIAALVVGVRHARAATGDDPPHTIQACFEGSSTSYMRGGQAAGVSVEVMRAVAARIGLPITFRPLPWARCLHWVEMGEGDVAMDGVPRPMRFLNGNASYSFYTYVLWVPRDSPSRTYTREAFANTRISVVNGWKYDETSLPPGAELDPASTQAMALQMAASGRVAAYYGDAFETERQVKGLGLPLRPLYPALGVDLQYPLFAKNRPRLKAQFDAMLGTMLGDGTVDAIYRRELGVTRAELIDKAWAILK